VIAIEHLYLLYVTKSDFLIDVNLLVVVYVFIILFFRQGLSGLPTVRSMITAIEIAIDYMLYIGPPEAVLSGEMIVVDLHKGFKIKDPVRRSIPLSADSRNEFPRREVDLPGAADQGLHDDAPPAVFGHGADEDVSDCSFLPDLQFTQGDIFDPFEILLVVRKKM
jgi:hypothetical protein